MARLPQTAAQVLRVQRYRFASEQYSTRDEIALARALAGALRTDADIQWVSYGEQATGRFMARGEREGSRAGRGRQVRTAVLDSAHVVRPLLQDLEELRRRLAPHVGRARKVIAFGSVARGDPDEWSDLDLIIVTETSRPFLERFKDFAGLYDVWPRLDLLIYTPAEFERMIAEENPLVLDAVREGVVLHSAE